jgi:hypothetical protein
MLKYESERVSSKSQMCDFCIPILGRGGFPHTAKECALKQSARCSDCGSGVHFRTQCPKRRQHLHPQAKAMASIPASKPPPHIEMSNSVGAYMEYLRQNNVEIPKKISDIRSAVQTHLLEQDTPLVLVNPLPLNPSCPVDATLCKKMHGENMHCVEPPPVQKKKRVLVVKY